MKIEIRPQGIDVEFYCHVRDYRQLPINYKIDIVIKKPTSK